MKRTVPRKCPECNGKTYICDTLTRKCEDCGYFYTGMAIHFYKVIGWGYNVALFEDGKLVNSYKDGKYNFQKIEVAT